MNLYDVVVEKRNGDILKLSDLKGKVLIIVNTATGCGFTPQYDGLEKLYEKYHESGLEILDFPCNQFGHQAPGSDQEIHEFCSLKYKTKFDQMKKIDVNGENEEKLFTILKEKQPEDIIIGTKNKLAMKAVLKLSSTYKKNEDIKWNFTKFLVDRDGNIIKRYSPTYDPLDIEKDILEII